MRYKDALTTVVPLNLSLISKTIHERILWWVITILSTATLIYVCWLLVLKFNQHDKIVVITLRSNNLPFPAVTFCNLNPYKKSALASLPDLAELVRVYKNVTDSINKTWSNDDNSDAEVKKRSKRAGCVCTCSSWYQTGYNTTTYKRCSDMSETWDCAFSCCVKILPGQFDIIEVGRIVPDSGGGLVSWLHTKNIIQDTPAWTGMRGSASGYHWYDNATLVGPAVTISSLCSNCVDQGSSTGGPVLVKWMPGPPAQAAFDNTGGQTTAGVFCSYRQSPNTTTAASTSTTKLTTKSSTKSTVTTKTSLSTSTSTPTSATTKSTKASSITATTLTPPPSATGSTIQSIQTSFSSRIPTTQSTITSTAATSIGVSTSSPTQISPSSVASSSQLASTVATAASSQSSSETFATSAGQTTSGLGSTASVAASSGSTMASLSADASTSISSSGVSPASSGASSQTQPVSTTATAPETSGISNASMLATSAAPSSQPSSTVSTEGSVQSSSTSGETSGIFSTAETPIGQSTSNIVTSASIVSTAALIFTEASTGTSSTLTVPTTAEAISTLGQSAPQTSISPLATNEISSASIRASPSASPAADSTIASAGSSLSPTSTETEAVVSTIQSNAMTTGSPLTSGAAITAASSLAPNTLPQTPASANTLNASLSANEQSTQVTVTNSGLETSGSQALVTSESFSTATEPAVGPVGPVALLPTTSLDKSSTEETKTSTSNVTIQINSVGLPTPTLILPTSTLPGSTLSASNLPQQSSSDSKTPPVAINKKVAATSLSVMESTQSSAEASTVTLTSTVTEKATLATANATSTEQALPVSTVPVSAVPITFQTTLSPQAKDISRSSLPSNSNTNPPPSSLSTDKNSRFASAKLTTGLNNKMPTTSKAINTVDLVQELQNALAVGNNDLMAISATANDIVPYLMASLPPEVAIAAGYSAKEMIFQCVYNGVRCSFKDFQLRVDPNYGNCYTFNADGERMVATEAGVNRGLSVTVTVGQNQYLDYVLEAGVRVIVQDQDEAIFPDNFGFNVASGYQSAASLTRTHASLIPTTNTPCADSKNAVATFNYNSSYSPEACLRSCYQKSVIDKCNCGDPRVPLPLSSSLKFCDISNRNCVNDFYGVGDDESQCDCPPACESKIYEVQGMTTGKWSRNADTFLRFLSNRLSQNGTLDNNELAKLNIYYEQLTVVEYTEAFAYGLLDLLSDISQVIGLFIGASVMSAFEIVHLRKCFKQSDN